jgi:DUF4097 and DUF4098 domain-containing protein YvlB
MKNNQSIQESAMSETIDQRFNIPSPARMSLSNIRGSVEIHPGEDGTIQVTAVKQSGTGDEKRTRIEITQEADGSVKVVTHFPDGSWNWLFGSQPCEVDYVVKAPRLCSFKVNGVSNTVFVEGFEGEVSVSSVSGEISLRDLSGSVRIHTVSGELDGTRIKGSLNLETVSGDVELNESNLRSIHSNSVSGNLQIQTALGEGPYDFKSVSGDVCLSVPSESQCTGELRSVSGNLVSDFPVTSSSRSHSSQTVNLQGGGVRISVNTVSGDLSLGCNGKIPPAEEPSEPCTNEERRSVLERVERGELSVDEAVVQLQR